VKIGLASDSYGNVDTLEAAIDALFAAGADRVFFLGARYADVQAVLDRKRAGVQGRRPARPAAAGEETLGFLRAVEGVLRSQVEDGPAEKVDRMARRIVRVASKACPEYQHDRAPRKVFEMVDGLICCLVHDKADLTRDDIANATVLFHGNSGHPAIVGIGPRLFVTPGHLRAMDPDGRPPTYALLEVEGGAMELVVYSAFGQELKRERATVGARTKVSVK